MPPKKTSPALIGTTVCCIIPFVLFMFLIVVGALSGHNSSASGSSGDTPAVTVRTTAPVASLTASALLDAYDRNTVAADHQYTDKVLRVTGTVETIDRGVDQQRRELNRLILQPGTFDAVIDMASAIESAPNGPLPEEMHIGDHLHPNRAGHEVMAQAIDISEIMALTLATEKAQDAKAALILQR